MALQAAPLICTTIVTKNGKFLSVSCNYGTTEPSNSFPGSSDRHAQLLITGNSDIIWNLDKNLVRVMLYNICDYHQYVYELFRSCSYDPNQNKSSTGFQTFDTGPFIFSFKITSKKLRKVPKIILLQFLTVSCR